MVIAKRKTIPKARPEMSANTTLYQDEDERRKYYDRAPGPEKPMSQETGVPRAIFMPHANSLPFEERRVSLEQPAKIGRNVYRATPSANNTIFECRVLSRHHATLYYEKGHFYLLDNQSSNGTFINNNQCSISKNQEPNEVFSGDIVKFGISVVENVANSGTHTFPPVIAQLKLFHPDGKEAKLSFNPTMTTPLHLKELYQLNNFVQEAIQREASLENRIRNLRECVDRTRASAQASWELFVGEQQLLLRVRTLESMLAAGKQPDAAHVAQLLEDKNKYQEVAQESLRLAHEQRLALEESLERRSREAAALHQHNCALRLTADSALQELQKLAARCERKMCAAKLAISAAEEREAAVRAQLPLSYSVQNGEAKMLILSTDGANTAEQKRGTLEDAVRALPDYIKLLLPQNILAKVGIKAITAEGKSAKEFELILKKNNIYDAECKEKQETEHGGGSGEETKEADHCTDDEKQSRLNHDTTVAPEGADGELCADNNANSTFSEHDNRDDEPSKGGMEYANILCVMAGLNDEIKALRERLNAAKAENDQLRNVRDELLATQPETKEEEAAETEDYRSKIVDLEEQLSCARASEEANQVEMQRLASSAAVMQAELAFRPTRGDCDTLAATVAELRAELRARDELIQDYTTKRAEDKCCMTEPLEDCSTEELDAGKISAEIDDLFRLDDDDDELSDSAATEPSTEVMNDKPSEYVKLGDEQRLRVTMANGALHALEEELVRAKERWAEASEERARLAAQLATLHAKPALSPGRALAVALPVLAAALYWLLLPYIS